MLQAESAGDRNAKGWALGCQVAKSEYVGLATRYAADEVLFCARLALGAGAIDQIWVLLLEDCRSSVEGLDTRPRCFTCRSLGTP